MEEELIDGLSAEDFARAERIRGIAKIAAEAKKTKADIERWIEKEPGFKAVFRKGEFEITKGDLDDWIANGCKPGLATYMREINSEIIKTFKEFDKGKNVTHTRTARIPLDWEQDIRHVFDKYPIFENNMSSLIRCAIWNLLVELNTLEKESGGIYDPTIEQMNRNRTIRDRVTKQEMILEGIRATLNKIKENWDEEEADDFIQTNKQNLGSFKNIWQRRVKLAIEEMEALKVKNAKKKRVRSEEEKEDQRWLKGSDFITEDEDEI